MSFAGTLRLIKLSYSTIIATCALIFFISTCTFSTRKMACYLKKKNYSHRFYDRNSLAIFFVNNMKGGKGIRIYQEYRIYFFLAYN